MSLMSMISSLVKRPDPNEAAKKIVEACFVWGADDRFDRTDYFVDKYLRVVSSRSKSYDGKTIFYDGSEGRTKPIVLAAALTDLYLASYMHARKVRILNEIKAQILDAAARSVHDFDFNRKFYECMRFVSSEMHLLPYEIDEKIRYCTRNTEDWQRVHACSVNWMVQQIKDGKAEHYVDFGSYDDLSKEGGCYIIRASNTIDEVMHNLYTFDINEPW